MQKLGRKSWHSRLRGQKQPKDDYRPEQAKLWALREVLGKLGESTTQYDWMSKQVHVMGKGGAKGDHPGRAAVKKFFDRVDLVGPNWYPGVQQTPRTGRPVELTSNKRAIISRSMMAAKKKGPVARLRPGARIVPAGRHERLDA